MDYNSKKIIICLFLLHISLMYAVELTQSQAHLSVNYNLVQRWYNFQKNPFYKQLYDQAVLKEKQFNNTHYVFYNAFSNVWRVPQDLYLRLYKKVYQLSIDTQSFRMFRWFSLPHKLPEQLLQEELINNGLIDDNELHLKAYLLSTNLALFGNTGFGGECTFEFFLNAKSKTRVTDDTLKYILDLFDNPAKYGAITPPLYVYVPKITQLTNYLTAKPLPNGKQPQTLTQIFIPKEIVDKVAYLAWVRGNPYNPELIQLILSKVGLKVGDDMESYEMLKPTMNELSKLLKKQKEKHPLFKDLIRGIKAGNYTVSKTLDVYKKTPAQLPDMNYLQARLIVSPEYIGNITANIKIFTYDALTVAQKQQYEHALDAVVNEIVEALVKINGQRTISVRQKSQTQKQKSH